MSRVRFQLLFGAASMRPYRMGWPVSASVPLATAGLDGDVAGPANGDEPSPVGAVGPLRTPGYPDTTAANWYGWRLISANNRELGRSAVSLETYPRARHAVRHIQERVDRLVRHTLVDPATGRWSWRLDLDGEAVAVSGRWYERDHDSRLGMAKFIALTPGANLADGVVTLSERRRIAVPRRAIGAFP